MASQSSNEEQGISTKTPTLSKNEDLAVSAGNRCEDWETKMTSDQAIIKHHAAALLKSDVIVLFRKPCTCRGHAVVGGSMDFNVPSQRPDVSWNEIIAA